MPKSEWPGRYGPRLPSEEEREARERRWRRLVEERIQEAMARGEFDHLPMAGKPLELKEYPFVRPDLRMPYKVLADAGFAPDWIELDKEVRQRRERCRRMADAHLEWVERRLRRLAAAGALPGRGAGSPGKAGGSGSRALGASRQARAAREDLMAVHREVLGRLRAELEELNGLIDRLNRLVPTSDLQRRRVDVDAALEGLRRRCEEEAAAFGVRLEER